VNLDFTFTKYKKLCEKIVESEYTTLTFAQYFSSKNIPNKFIILRHDVDRKPENALKMAELENKLGIKSTYYFRSISQVFKPDIIKAINDFNHEIGYHYEVLDEAKGDLENAIRIFGDALNKFREICDVRTICMHGNPLSSWDNRNLWKRYDFKDFGIIGEPYLSIDYKETVYLTDTGRSWNSKFSVKDNVNLNASQAIEAIKNTDDVIRAIIKGNIEHLCITAHPNRWSESFGAWLKELLWQNVKNVGKAGIISSKKTFYD